MQPRHFFILISLVVLTFLLLPLYPFPRQPLTLTPSQAVIDIRRGKVRLMQFGIAGASTEMNKVAARFGFEEVNMGCVVGYTRNEKKYDSIARAWLDKRNGAGWEYRYADEVEALNKNAQ